MSVSSLNATLLCIENGDVKKLRLINHSQCHHEYCTWYVGRRVLMNEVTERVSNNDTKQLPLVFSLHMLLKHLLHFKRKTLKYRVRILL